MKFTLLGCGRWGSFIAWYLDKNGNKVTVWGRKGFPEIENLLKTRTNEYVTLPETIDLTTDLQKAIDASEYIIISISSQAVRELMQSVKQISGYQDKKFILCMKGLEETSGDRLSTILIEEGVSRNNIAVWVGPGHIQSFVNGIPSVMIIDSYNSELSLFLANYLRSNLIRFYQGQDIVGSEIGAASKNVMGIAAGLLDGMGYSSLKGALMARGAREISRLIKACGGNELSAYGLCHLGDYEATLFSKYSHNRMWGEAFAKGEKFDKLAEGVATSSALLSLASHVGVELPITKSVFDVIHGNITKENAIKILLTRENIKEF